MSIYNLSYTQKVIDLLPPDKRYPKILSWVNALLFPIGQDNTEIFIDYKTGSTYPVYNPIATYSKGNRVIYGQSVYESLVNGNDLVPTEVEGWRVYLEYFIGVDERVKYTNVKLVLEYALNKRFLTQFKQPPLVSDIFLTVNSIPSKPFTIGNNDISSSVTYDNRSLEYVVNEYFVLGVTNNLNINVPISVYNALANDNLTRTNIIRNFADKYVAAGILYTIITY
jgi:hypothetical protein